MSRTVDFNTILSLIDYSIKPAYLNQTQELVLKEVWNGKTYSKIAQDCNYDPEYIKTVGCNLWKTLSSAFNEPINKSNFVSFMRCRVGSLSTVKNEDIETTKNPQLESINHQFHIDYNWATVPKTSHFMGRKNELSILESCSQDVNCNCIVVSGMVGSGKTDLLKSFAEKVKYKFDYIIWVSLITPSPITTLIKDCLKRIDKNHENISKIDLKQQDLSSLLSYFINCLRNNKVLLLLDNLESVLEIDDNSFSYKRGLENYGDFLRSIVSTNHQSLLVCGSRVKLKALEYYGTNQVKLIDLQGLNQEYIFDFLTTKTSGIPNEEKILKLSESLQNNLKLLHIVDKHINFFEEYLDDIHRISEELSLLEAVASLLEQELNCLSKLEKKIVLWLAISSFPISQECLINQTNYHNSKIKFSSTIQSLKKRSLVIEQDSELSLMLVMKSYLRRKMVKQSL